MQMRPFSSNEPTVKAISADVANTPALTVERLDNHVYFYADVNTDRCLALIRNIREIDNYLRNERLSRGIPNDYPQIPIWLHINSPGGDLFTGLGIADQLASIHSPVYSVVEGVCASAATLISTACTKRYMLSNSFMLIHQFFTVMWGTYEQFKDEMVLQDMLIQRMATFYQKRSKMTEDSIREALKHDTWMDSGQALEKGFVDEVI